MDIRTLKGIGMQLLALANLLASVQPAFGIPAFARKYGLGRPFSTMWQLAGAPF
jgi:hypothetical protein